MNKLLKGSTKIFYSILIFSLIFGIGYFGFGFFKSLSYPIVYLFIYVLIPLLILSFLIILILNFRSFGFINGVKETSINIFALILSSLLLWTLQKNMIKKSSQINVNVINKTDLGISNITLIGRNAKSKIDTLAPKQSQTIIFKGKKINYKTENDFENEIRLLFYYDKKWRENKILSGFSRWRVINKDWEINIHSADSIDIKQI